MPLHTSPAGQKFSRYNEKLVNTDYLSRRIVRLPLWVGLTKKEQERIIYYLYKFLKKNNYKLFILGYIKINFENFLT